MSNRGQYRVCPYCGDHIDHGELCDCQKEREAAPVAPGTTSGKSPRASLSVLVQEVKRSGRYGYGGI